MGCLSPEILFIVAFYLHRKDIPNFRLASRALADIAIRYLSIKKHFFFRKHSLERLQKVARHPVLAKNLHEIVFHIDIVPKFESKRDWEHQARATCHTNPDSDDLAIEWLREYRFYEVTPVKNLNQKFRHAAWQLHRQIRNEQESLLQDEGVFESLRSSLIMFPNLKVVKFDSFEDYHRELMRPLYILSPDQAWYSCNYTCALESFHEMCPRLLKVMLTSNKIQEESLKPVGLQLRTIDVRGMHLAKFEDFTPDASVYTIGLENMENLRLDSFVFEERLNATDASKLKDFKNNTAGPHASFMQKLLSKTPRLRNLYLSTGAMSPAPDSQSLLQGCFWRELVRLELQDITIVQSSFETFLSSHATCLRDLCLFNVDICGGGGEEYAWIELCSFIRDNLELRDFDLGGYLYDVYRDAKFDVEIRHVFESGMSITIEDLVKFLVCRRDPSLIGQEFRGNTELLSVTWQALEVAYVHG